MATILADTIAPKAIRPRTANARLKALINIGLELASEPDADRLVGRVCAAARDLFGATYVTLGLLDPEDQTLQRVVTIGTDAADWIKAGDTVAGLLGTVVAGRGALRGDNRGAAAGLNFPDRHPEVQAFLAAPLAAPGRLLGWICVVGNEGRIFTEEDEHLLTALAGQAGRLYESACLAGVAAVWAGELEHQIVERRRAEVALSQERDQTQRYLDTVQVMMVALDLEGRITFVNHHACSILGWTVDELIGHPFETFLPNLTRSAQRDRFNDILADDLPTSESHVVTKSGEERLIGWRNTVLRDGAGQVIGTLSSGTDNTARRRVEAEHQALDQRLHDQQFYTRSLIESNIDPLMTIDSGGIITDVNRQTEALTGCTRGELIGAPFKNHFTDADRAEAGIKRVLAEGHVTNYELTARARDGTETVVSYNATTFHDRERRLQGVFAAARDVTEVKHFEHALRQKNGELEHAGRMKSEFLANMSHELRTPLNAIIGFSEVLRDGLLGEMPDRQRAFVGDIFASGQHLLSLINDILDLSKVEAGQMTLELEPVEMASVFVNGLSMVREKAAIRRIHIDMDAGDGGPVRADARKVKQIVYNLLANAVKFSGNGGSVSLRAVRVARADVGRLSGTWTGRSLPLAESEFAEFLQLTVTDDGIGIPPEGLARLFTPFTQIDGGLARKFEGSGLGLALVRRLVELHGGTVAVESAPGEGSSFTVWLPIRGTKDSTVPAGMPAVGLREVPDGIRTALVVEDHVNSAALIRLQLEAEGFKVLVATSAEAGLRLALEEPLSLITLDIMLPDIDGWEFLGRLKQHPRLQRVPVVLISMVAEPNRGFALGAAAVLQKPISRQELHETLIDLGLFPFVDREALTVLVVDDDPKAVELVAVRALGLASTILRAYGGREAIDLARRELPDVIVLDLMMPEVNGFDVVAALQERPETAVIPILVVTAKTITPEDRTKLRGQVTRIMEKAEFDTARFIAEVRRALSGRNTVS